MLNNNLYKDIATRTGGDIYIGVVGPVRTGKSTFISKVMDSFVLPNIKDKYTKERVIDEMPQSGDGNLIMTTQPKFVPNEAININAKNTILINTPITISIVNSLLSDSSFCFTISIKFCSTFSL